MLRRTVIIFLLISLSNYLISCYSVEEVNKNNLDETEKIVEVVLHSGESIKYDQAGARYNYKEEAILGTQEGDTPLEIRLSLLSELRTKIFPVSVNEAGNEKITEAILINQRSLIFNDKGAVIDKNRGILKGTDKYGNYMEIKVDNIQYVYITPPVTISKEDFARNNIPVKQVLSLYNVTKTFQDPGGKYLLPGYTIKGVTGDKKIIEHDLEEISYIAVERFNYVNSCFTVVGVVAFAAAVAFATKESCPFIYSFDGQKYVFDAEPLGGATSKGLQREEVSLLENIKSVDGKYKLRIVNEVDETQYLDYIGLSTVDHPAGTEVVYSTDGKAYLIKSTVSPYYSNDDNGNTLNKFFEKEDNISWQTNMVKYLKNNDRKTREEIILAFPKPKSAKSVQLIYDVGTTLWGSNMIKEMLLLYGNDVDNWYEKIDKKEAEYYQMMNFLHREELYELKLLLKEKDGWNQNAVIQGAGPFLTEKRILHLDISRTEGDTLYLKMNPPAGFWSFDYMSVSYDQVEFAVAQSCKLLAGVSDKNENVSEIVGFRDNVFYSMPVTGEYFDMEFEVPELKKGMVRSVFAETKGYYNIHLPKNSSPDYHTLFMLGANSGSIVKYSNEKYKEWMERNIALLK